MEFGDLRGPWTLPQGSRLQRWISWKTRKRHHAGGVVLEIQEWAGVKVKALSPLSHEIWIQ